MEKIARRSPRWESAGTGLLGRVWQRRAFRTNDPKRIWALRMLTVPVSAAQGNCLRFTPLYFSSGELVQSELGVSAFR